MITLRATAYGSWPPGIEWTPGEVRSLKPHRLPVEAPPAWLEVVPDPSPAAPVAPPDTAPAAEE